MLSLAPASFIHSLIVGERCAGCQSSTEVSYRTAPSNPSFKASGDAWIVFQNVNPSEGALISIIQSLHSIQNISSSLVSVIPIFNVFITPFAEAALQLNILRAQTNFFQTPLAMVPLNERHTQGRYSLVFLFSGSARPTMLRSYKETRPKRNRRG